MSNSIEDPVDLPRTGSATLPGTCGELFQGLLEGQPCLVSCPIDLFSTAQVRIEPGQQTWRSHQPVSKALASLTLASAQWDWAKGGVLTIDSRLPQGRGYGSSTADIGAALYALTQAAEQSLDPMVAARIATQIEPSDGTFFPELVLFAHRNGERLATLGPAPMLTVIVLDPGGEIDTLAYNREVTSASLCPFSSNYQEAFDLLKTGLVENNWALIGQGATLSSRTHQSILFNPMFDLAMEMCKRLNGLGVCRAHSGTIFGLLLDSRHIAPESALHYVRSRIPEDVRISLQRLVSGGPRRLPKYE